MLSREHVHTGSTIELKNKDLSAEILKKVYELSDGAYLLSFAGYQCWSNFEKDNIPGHATAIIVENGNYYFFDPNVGLAATGRDIGTDDKTNDVGFFLAMCMLYSPYERADSLFQKGLIKLSEVVGSQEAKIIQEVVPEYRNGMSCLSAYAVLGIIDGFKKRGRIFSESEVDHLFDSLCVSPGLMQVNLEMSQALRLRKFTFLG